jgi:predicted RNA methylase
MNMATMGNLEPLRVHIRGFDAAARVFLLRIVSPVSHPSAVAKRRSIGDFQALDRAVAHGTKRGDTPVPRLSLRRLKKLTETSWRRDDATAGWRRELQKNVAACEQWVEAALASAYETARLRFVDDDAYAAHHCARAERQQLSQRARQLQQYFTSESVLCHVMSRLRDVLARLQLPAIESEQVLWVEPSCGDGRVVDALIAAGAKRVIGWELDDRVWSVAHSKLEKHATIEHGDFLVSSPPPVGEEPTVVMALGNPPFGEEDPSSASSQRDDLVAKFVVHTVHVWCAQLVAFIVPSRCGRAAYLEALLASLNSAGDGSERGVACQTWSVVRNEPLDDCTFEFLETKRVKQPSALVVLAFGS